MLDSHVSIETAPKSCYWCLRFCEFSCKLMQNAASDSNLAALTIETKFMYI